MMKLTILLVLALLTCDALAQQRTVYGPDGKVRGASPPTAKAPRQSTTRLAVSLDARPLTAKASLRSTTLPVAGRARSRTAEASDDDRSNLDAVNRRCHWAGDNAADGGRTSVDGRNRTASLT